MGASPQNSQRVRRAILALEIVLLGAICFVLVRAAISFFAPESVWSSPPKTPLDITQSASRGAPVYTPNFSAFSQEVSPEAVPVEIGIDAPETSLNLTLVGRRAEPDPQSELGSAIIQTPDGQQKPYYVGDEIIRGVTLKAVSEDFVTLSLDGKLERLSMENGELSVLQRPQDAAPTENVARVARSAPVNAGPTPSRPASAGTLTVQQFLQAHRLTRETTEEGELLGYRIEQTQPGFDLSSVGLQSGDIVQKIGNSDLTRGQAQWARIISDISEGRVNSVTVLRGGQSVTTKVDMP